MNLSILNFVTEVVRINFKLVLQLNLPIVKYRVSSVCKQ